VTFRSEIKCSAVAIKNIWRVLYLLWCDPGSQMDEKECSPKTEELGGGGVG